MCCICGREYCLSCYEECDDFDETFKETRKCSRRRQHYKEQLVPIYHYTKEEILKKQVVAIVNFPVKQIANFFSECLVMGVYNETNEVVLLQPNMAVKNGCRVG